MVSTSPYGKTDQQPEAKLKQAQDPAISPVNVFV
jgi:hypothetical protein